MPRVFLPAILSGVLLWAAFFPLNLGALGFIALVPWLSLVRADVSRRRRYAAAYLGGFVFSALATEWVRVAHPMMYISWAAFSLVLPLFWILALDLIRRLDRVGVPLALAVPIVWVGLEYMRMHFPTGYPFLKPLGFYQMIGFGWYFLGYTQHANLWLIQIADLGGVYAVSLVVAALNGMVADWLWCGRSEKGEQAGRTGRTVATIATLALLIGAHTYGYSCLQHPAFAPGPRVAAIQGSIPQAEKMAKGQSLGLTYGSLHSQAVDSSPKPDLIVWPETCYPVDWVEVPPGETASPEFANYAARSVEEFATVRYDVPTLLGLSGIVWEGDRPWKYNSALLVDPKGNKLGRYDKMHLVPFGEYVPFGETLPFMQWFTPYEKEYSCRPGTHWTRFALPSASGDAFTFACLICYEDSDPYLARQYVASEPVNFFVNISNDGWFNGTEEHEEHLAICRFRAVEARRSIVRAVNMGISAAIDPDGRVIALAGETWSKSKKVEGIASVNVPIDSREALYPRLGDWVPAACWIGILIGVVAGLLRRAKSVSAP
jgi:apolipoprotein N-acyltransferase